MTFGHRFRNAVLMVAACLLSNASWTAAVAQNPFSPALFVNSTIVTHYEIDQRIRLLRALAAPSANLEEVAIQQLTEDAIKGELAASLGMSVTDEGYQEALETYAEQRQMSVGGLQSRLRNAGVDNTIFEEFLKNGIMWRNIVRNRFQNRARPSEADMENVLNFAAGSARESVFIREIAIPYAERGVEGARNLAARIQRDVRNGASFAALAREFSRMPTAQHGGSRGWTPVNRLPPPIASRILPLQPGEVAAPLEVPAGVILFQLVDIRADAADARDDVLATYVRLDLPLPDGPTMAQIEDANTTASRLIRDNESCTQAEALASGFGPMSGRYGPEPVSLIPDQIGMVLMDLDADEAGISVPGPDGVSVVFLCNRSVDIDPEQVEVLRGQLFNQRMTRFAADYLQELLADAVIREN